MRIGDDIVSLGPITPDPWEEYQTTDPRPWIDANGNRHTYRTKKFDTPEKYLAEGCVWSPRS